MLCLLLARGVGSMTGGELDKIPDEGLVITVEGVAIGRAEDVPLD